MSRLTIHSSRSRFAARLNSGVRPQDRVPRHGAGVRRKLHRPLRGLFRSHPSRAPTQHHRSAPPPACARGLQVGDRRKLRIPPRARSDYRWATSRPWYPVGRVARARPSRLRCQKQIARPQVPVHSWALTIHSSRSRFAARLNSGVRPQDRVPRHGAGVRRNAPQTALRTVPLLPFSCSHPAPSLCPATRLRAWLTDRRPDKTRIHPRARPDDRWATSQPWCQAGCVARARPSRLRCQKQIARPQVPVHSWALTIHSSRKPIAARLFSA